MSHNRTEAQQPPVTVVVPVRNRAAIVGRTLDSIHSQSFRPMNVVLVDNASTDNTREVLDSWASRVADEDFSVKVVTESQPGASRARNRGLSEVTTPYVMFFDSDDVMKENHVERVVDAIKAHPDAPLFFWDVAMVEPEGWLKVMAWRDRNLMRSHIFHSSLSTQRMAIATSVFREAGGWNDSLCQWDDLELGLRLLLHPEVEKSVVYITGEPTVMIYFQEESITGTDYNSVADNMMRALDAMDSAIDSSSRDANEKNMLHLWIDMRRADLAGHLAAEGNRRAAVEIMNEILPAAPTLKDALIMRGAYLTVRLFGRGAYVMAPYLSLRPIKVKD